MYQRMLAGPLRDALADTPAVLICGPRQVGKSTLVKTLTDRTYHTLDDDLALGGVLNDPRAWLAAQPGSLTIDEVQRAPGLFLAMKAAIDRQRDPGRFLLTGSANVLAMPKVSDSLAGRVEVLQMLPLAQAEIEGGGRNFVDNVLAAEFLPTPRDPGRPLSERIAAGGYPDPLSRATVRRRSEWARAYVTTLLDRDLRDLAQLENVGRVAQFLAAIGGSSGGALNLTSLARESGVPHTTATRYYELLKRLFLLQEVPAWSVDHSVRLIRSPRVYAIDPLIAATLGADRLTEGFVANELARLITGAETPVELMHLRTVKSLEVDFVLQSPTHGIVGIDVRPSPAVGPDDFRGLRYLRELAGVRFRRGLVLYEGSEIHAIEPDLYALPIAQLW